MSPMHLSEGKPVGNLLVDETSTRYRGGTNHADRADHGPAGCVLRIPINAGHVLA